MTTNSPANRPPRAFDRLGATRFTNHPSLENNRHAFGHYAHFFFYSSKAGGRKQPRRRFVEWFVSQCRNCERVSVHAAGHLIWVGPDADVMHQTRMRFLKEHANRLPSLDAGHDRGSN